MARACGVAAHCRLCWSWQAAHSLAETYPPLPAVAAGGAFGAGLLSQTAESW